MPLSHLEQRVEICEFGRRLWQRGLVGAAEGNLSVRLSTRRILCSPSGFSKGHMKPADLVVIDMNGETVEGANPSSEIRVHLAIYGERSDCLAVIHAHPPVATAFAMTGEMIPDNVLPEGSKVLGSVALARFGISGTQEVADRMKPLLQDHKTILMSHHGAVVMGKSIEDAYNRMETLERVATTVLHARTIGAILPLPDHLQNELEKRALHGRLD